MVACVKFQSNFSVEARTVMFYSPGWNEEFTVVCDRGCEVFCCCVYAGEGVYVEVCECSVNVVSECVPVGSVVVSVGAFGWACDGFV